VNEGTIYHIEVMVGITLIGLGLIFLWDYGTPLGYFIGLVIFSVAIAMVMTHDHYHQKFIRRMKDCPICHRKEVVWEKFCWIKCRECDGKGYILLPET